MCVHGVTEMHGHRGVVLDELWGALWGAGIVGLAHTGVIRRRRNRISLLQSASMESWRRTERHLSDHPLGP